MMKQVAKADLFGVPSLETAGRIDDSDKMAGLQAASFVAPPACESLNASSRSRHRKSAPRS